MSRFKLERELIKAGYRLVKHSKHNHWSNGTEMLLVPHHSEVSKGLSRSIMKRLGYDKN